ncbi:MAG TPA: biotin/lipoate A/B protein ligase family protein, partial [Thermoanaerobaculia bacterium]|nr:biotin/lipoate A/B protein ligase family protein [Thermoanaerobaculia bacterium]
MTEPIRLLDLGEVSAVRSQALYHGLARGMTESSPDTIVLCRSSETYFCVGYHQDPEVELDLDFCQAHGYPVLHRQIGGGTVVLDRDQLLYQVILHVSRSPLRVDAIYEKFLAAPVATLQAIGLPARLEGTNEIEVRGRRIAGTGGGRIGDAMVVTGNLLLDFPYELMTRSWRTPTEQFRDVAGDALRRSVTTLRKELEHAPSMDALNALLVQKYRETLARPLVDGLLTPAESAAVR